MIIIIILAPIRVAEIFSLPPTHYYTHQHLS